MGRAMSAKSVYLKLIRVYLTLFIFPGLCGLGFMAGLVLPAAMSNSPLLFLLVPRSFSPDLFIALLLISLLRTLKPALSLTHTQQAVHLASMAALISLIVTGFATVMLLINLHSSYASLSPNSVTSLEGSIEFILFPIGGCTAGLFMLSTGYSLIMRKQPAPQS